MTEQLISATQDAEHETWSASFFGALRTSPYTLCIGGDTAGFKIKGEFFSDVTHFGRIFSPNITQKLYAESEEATRQQGWPLL